GLRDAICDEMLAHSAGRSEADLSDRAGQADLIARSTVLNVLHQEGAELLAAQHRRAGAALDEHAQAPALVSRPPPAAAADAELEPEPSGPAAEPGPSPPILPVGFTSAATAAAVAADEPRAVDPGRVLVELDEVKTKAQKSTGRKHVLTFTGA